MTIEIAIFMLVFIVVLTLSLKPDILKKFKKKKDSKKKDEACLNCEEESCDTCPLISDFNSFKEEYYRDRAYEDKDNE